MPLGKFVEAFIDAHTSTMHLATESSSPAQVGTSGGIDRSEKSWASRWRHWYRREPIIRRDLAASMLSTHAMLGAAIQTCFGLPLAAYVCHAHAQIWYLFLAWIALALITPDNGLHTWSKNARFYRASAEKNFRRGARSRADPALQLSSGSISETGK